MTTKTTKVPPAPEVKASEQELRAAYEVHTLAQMLYGQLGAWQSTPAITATAFAPVWPAYGMTSVPLPRMWTDPRTQAGWYPWGGV